MEKTLDRRSLFLTIAACSFIGPVCAGFLLLMKHLDTTSLRGFWIADVTMLLIGFIAFMVPWTRAVTLIPTSRPALASEQSSKSVQRRILVLQVGVAFMLVLLTGGLWAERHAMRWPVLTVAAMILLYTSTLVVAVKRLQSSTK